MKIPTLTKFQAFILTALYCLVFCSIIGQRLGIDFQIYRQAALGNFEIDMFGYKWLYADWLSTLWVPFTLFPYQVAFMLWYLILIASCGFISTKLLEVRHGFFLLFPAAVAYSFCLYPGNVYPVLIALSFSPWGIVLASVVKPQLLGLILVMAIGKGYRARFRSRVHSKHRFDSPSSRSLASVSQRGGGIDIT